MGPKETKEVTMYLNGEEIGPITSYQETLSIPESDESYRMLGIDLAQGQDFTISFTPKWLRISRKKFIRQLQKLGYPKKKAKKIAWETQRNKRTSYSYTYFLYSIGALPHYKELIWSI